jgi:glycosyltransferase involved in cell wall biosynthesis
MTDDPINMMADPIIQTGRTCDPASSCPSPVPLLILSDAITSSTGLARIARDLATRIHADSLLRPLLRIGTLGVGGSISTSSAYPFPNYSIQNLGAEGKMVPQDLPEVWLDFAGRVGDGRQQDPPAELLARLGSPRRGILLAIWNASWCGWLARPETALPPGHLVREFLLQRPATLSLREWQLLQQASPSIAAERADRPFRRWLYCPVDGHCADGTLGWQMADVIGGFDRVLAYTGYGARVLERTMRQWGGQGQSGSTGNAIVPGSVAVADPRAPFACPHLPHGTDPAVFHPRFRALARQTLVSRLSNGAKSVPLLPDQTLLAVVATNTQRKDWGLAFATCAELLARGRNVLLWGHTDRLASPGYWDMACLAKQYGMADRVLISTTRLTDRDMAECYAAADVMLGVGSEGWGLPLSEALACGLPVVHMDYAGAAEFTPPSAQSTPVGFTIESPFMIQRPVFRASDWADKVEMVMRVVGQVDELTAVRRSLLPAGLDWDAAWLGWQEWFRQGVTP